MAYPVEDTTHAVGLRVEYSDEEGAYYICGAMADRKFEEIEISSTKYAGVNIVYNDDDTTLFVLHNSQGNEFSVMEVKQSDGSIVQDPMAFKFTDNSTSNDTARAHMMHYFNDTLIISGNHFADQTSGLLTENKQFLYRFDINADSLKENFSDMIHYSIQDTPDGHQRASYSYWTPENSVYLNNNLHLVGVYHEYGSHFGFKYVKVDNILESCIDTFDHISKEVHPDDTLSCTASTDNYTQYEVDFDWGNINVVDTLECVGKSSPLSVGNAFESNNEIWQFKRITSEGIEALLISDNETKYRINVYDILGRQVYNAEFNVTEGETTVHMNFEVKPEVYIIKVSDGAETKTRKVINLNH